MGQKVHPYGFRLGFNKTWRSRWYSDRDYAKLLHEDLALREDLKERFAHDDLTYSRVLEVMASTYDDMNRQDISIPLYRDLVAVQGFVASVAR